MKEIPFEWLGHGDLSAALRTPIVHVSVLEVSQRPNILTLWRIDGSFMRVCSKMHDVRERLEIGVLAFSLVLRPTKDTVEVDFSSAPLKPSRARKLRLEESGVAADSGILMEFDGHKEVAVVAGAYPYSLAIKGLFAGEHVCEPEYPLSRYKEINL